MFAYKKPKLSLGIKLSPPRLESPPKSLSFIGRRVRVRMDVDWSPVMNSSPLFDLRGQWGQFWQQVKKDDLEDIYSVSGALNKRIVYLFVDYCLWPAEG